jgi:putative superfamily III holin-X
MPPSERSVSEVLQDIVGNIQDIVRSEVRLAKTEVGEELTKAKAASLAIGGGALSGIFSASFLLLAIVYALSRVVPDWAAALIVAGGSGPSWRRPIQQGSSGAGSGPG